MMILCYLRNTAGHHDLLVCLEATRDLVLEVLLGGVLDGAGVEEPELGLLPVLRDGEALGRQLAGHVLAVRTGREGGVELKELSELSELSELGAWP